MSMVALFLILIVFGSLLGFGIFALRRGIKGVRRKQADASFCGHCGYDVRGVSSFECPECGSDLRVVGIDKTVRKRSIAWIVIGSIALIFSMFFFLGITSLFLVTQQKVTKVQTLQVQQVQTVPATGQ